MRAAEGGSVVDTIARGEMVEKELDAFIERRSRNGEVDPDEQEELWRESVRRFHEHSEAEMRHRWIEYEQHMTELHTRLAEEHRQKKERLCGEGEGTS
jgi:hypothetical protein